MEYQYSNVISIPDLDEIKKGVNNSSMADKTIECCNWKKSTSKLVVTFTNDLGADDKIILDDIVADNELIKTKKDKMKEIDKKTEDIITVTGFNFGGEHFDLEIVDQINYMGVNGGRDNLAYPFELPSADYTARYTFQNSAEIYSFYMTAVGTIKAIREGGWTLKESIVACSTIAEVDAIVDNR